MQVSRVDWLRVQAFEVRVWGLGFGVWGLGFGVWGLGFGVWGLGFGVWGLGFGVWGLGFGVWGLGAAALQLGKTLPGGAWVPISKLISKLTMAGTLFKLSCRLGNGRRRISHAMVQSLGFRVWVLGLGFRVWGLGFRV